MSVRGFRLLLVISLTLSVVLHLLPDAFPSSDPGIKRLLRFDGYHAVVYSNAFSVVPIWLALFAFVGLFFLQNWGRYLFLLAVASYVATSLLFGYRVGVPIEMFLGDIVSILDGVILAVAFSSPIKEHFVALRP